MMRARRLTLAVLATLGLVACSAAPALAAEAPAVLSESAPSPKAEEARLEAFVNAGEEAAECHFQYGKASVSEQEVPCEQAIIEGGEQGVGVTVTGLEPNTPYHYRVLVKNATGEAEGAEEAFTTTARPVLTIGEAQSITRTTATLPGTVNPEGLETSYYYQYGTTTSYGGNAPSVQGASAGSEPGAVPAAIGISGLVPATTYHYRLAATNADGTTYSFPDQTFTTAPATPPSASTGEASNITLTTATVAGTINPEGLETSYELDLGTDIAYGTSIYGEAGSASTLTQITLGLQNLAPASTYHYRIVAINSDGRIPGLDRTFTTPAYSNPITQPLTLPLIASPALAFPTETTNTGTGPAKPLTNKQKLTKALKACHKKHNRSKRKACERQARKKYGPVKAKAKGKKQIPLDGPPRLGQEGTG
jgi:hypothetical protein